MFHKRLLQEFRENRIYVAGMVLTQWFSLLANVVFMLVTAGFLELLQKRQLTGKGMTELIAAVLFAICVRGSMTHLNSKMSFLASTNVKTRLRDLIYRKLMALGAGYRNTIATAEAVQISTEGVEQLEIYFGRYVPQFFYSLLAPFTLFVIVGFLDIKVAAVLFICVPLIPLSIIVVQKFAKKMLRKYWGTYTELGDSFLESLQGLTTLKIYQADKRYADKMDEEAEQFRRITMKVLIMQLNSISIMDLVAYGGAALGMILSILDWRGGRITFAQCFFIMMISAEYFLPLRLLGSFFHIAMNGNAAADKIFGLLDAEEEAEGTKEAPESDEIRLNQVKFSYDGEKTVLKDLSVTIEENHFTALVGASGCGKSTIVSLLMKERELKQNGSSGSITIGGRALSEMTETALYKKVTRIRHDSYLFQGTLEENLRMGKEDATEAEMVYVLKQVDLYDTVVKKGGLSMQIGEKAANLSGGQKQRVALARAILHDSDIYIFDEATSNIDAESENLIMGTVRQLAKTKTVLMISHRLANAAEADRILVLEQGRIAEQGTHEELLLRKGYYSRLYKAQQELEHYGRAEHGKEAV